MAKLQVELVTPEGRVHSEEADFVLAPGVEGDLGSQVGLDNSLVSGNAQGLQSNGTMSLSNSSSSFKSRR